MATAGALMDPASQSETRAPAGGKVAVTTGGKVAAFVPATMEEAWRLSTALAASQMTPKSYNNDPNRIMVGIMAGAEVGLTPFAALQSIAVIGNNPSVWGDGALALIQASGLLEDMEETDDGQIAVCRVKRAGRATEIIRSFSMEDAKKAGLANKSGPWTQYPARMRQMRARAFALRDGFPDVLKGLHIAEEVRDYAPMNGVEALPSQEPLSAEHLLEQSRPQTTAEAISDEIPDFRENKPDDAPCEPAPLPDPSKPEGAPLDEPEEDEEPAAKFLSDIRAQVAAAKTVPALKKADERWLTNRVAYSDETQAEIDGLVAAKRRELQGGEG